jgi:hypothetical protein
MRKSRIALLGCLLIAGSTAVIVSICAQDSTRANFRSRLFTAVTTGDAPVRIPDYPATWSGVCLLTPYETRVRGGDELGDTANAILAKANFQGDESHYAFVFLGAPDPDQILKLARSRSTELYAIPGPNEHRELISKHRPVPCAAKEHAFLVPFGKSRFYLASVK